MVNVAKLNFHLRPSPIHNCPTVSPVAGTPRFEEKFVVASSNSVEFGCEILSCFPEIVFCPISVGGILFVREILSAYHQWAQSRYRES